MPLYNFKCNKCDNIKEIKCSYNDLGKTVIFCDCGEAMERTYSNGKCGLIYKGRGFSATDRWGDMSRERGDGDLMR